MQQQRGHIHHPPNKRPSVLIVDDQPDNLDLLVRILKKGGYNTRPALNGQLALGAVAHTRPDLILLDIRMPEMDGFEICKRLKVDPQSRSIPVIFISALDEADEKVRAFQAGGVDYISRPFQYPEVLARVSTHLELARMRNKMEALIQEHAAALDTNTGKLVQEITSHQATALQLRQSEKNFRFLVESQKNLTCKIESISTLVGCIALDLNNVFGNVIGHTEMILNNITEGPLNRQWLNGINKASQHGRDVIKQLMKLGRQTNAKRIPIDLGQNVKHTLQLIKASLPATISIKSQIDAPIHNVVGDSTQISQLLFNLCNNAAQAMDAMVGEVKITLVNAVVNRTDAQKLGVPAGDYAKLSVSDTGCGIEPDVLDKIFDPYFTTHKTGGGSGIELAIVHGIVGSHKGAIKVQSLVGQGTCFDIYLPAGSRPLKRVDARPGNEPGRKETILFIDDEARIARMAKTLLKDLGYTVWTETDPAKALQRFQNEPHTFNLVITDMTMPRLTGDRLAAEILKIRKDTPIILCSGHRDRIDTVKFLALGIRHYIEKPFKKHQLATVIRQALGGVEEKQKEDPAHQAPEPSLPVMTENG